MQPFFVILMLVSAFMDVLLILFAATRQDHRRAIYFATLTVGAFFYTIGYLVELLSQTEESILAALQVENIGISIIAPFFLLTTFSFFDKKALKNWMLPAALVYSASMSMITMFNAYHNLYYNSITLVFDGHSYFARMGHGPLYFVQQGISMALLLISYIYIVSRFIRGNRRLRRQMTFLIIGSLLPLFANIVNITGGLPSGLDLMPVALMIGFSIQAIAVFRYNILDSIGYSAQVAVRTMDDAFIVLDDSWGFLSCNDSAIRLFPALKDLKATEAVARLAEWPEELKHRDAGQIPFQRTADGHVYYYRANVNKMTDHRGRHIGWTILIRDVTNLNELMIKLEQQATHDPLTGILNRGECNHLMTRDLSKAQRFDLKMSLIMFDIDHFKNINDTYGHPTGDAVLCAVTETLSRQLREYDVFARYGGEEFVIFTYDKSAQGLADFAERLRATIDALRIPFEGDDIHVTASFGATDIDPSLGYAKALSEADAALYEAKRAGRNRVVVAPRG